MTGGFVREKRRWRPHRNKNYIVPLKATRGKRIDREGGKKIKAFYKLFWRKAGKTVKGQKRKGAEVNQFIKITRSVPHQAEQGKKGVAF